MCIAAFIYPSTSDGDQVFSPYRDLQRVFSMFQRHSNTLSTFSTLVANSTITHRSAVISTRGIYNIAARAVTAFAPWSSEQESAICLVPCVYLFVYRPS